MTWSGVVAASNPGFLRNADIFSPRTGAVARGAGKRSGRSSCPGQCHLSRGKAMPGAKREESSANANPGSARRVMPSLSPLGQNYPAQFIPDGKPSRMTRGIPEP